MTTRRTTRSITTVRTRAAATRWINKQESGVFDIVEAPVPTPFGAFTIVEVTEVCERSGLAPSKCACQVHAGFA